MTYKDLFVAEVKCNGKFLRVRDDKVYLPFGSEYSIYLKNMNTRRASVKISIDGQDVLDGNDLVLNGNSSVELEGFLKGITAKNKFKFIQKTKEIQDYRGDKADDGLIRIEFAYEKITASFDFIKSYTYTYHDTNAKYGGVLNEGRGCRDIYAGSTIGKGMNMVYDSEPVSMYYSSCNASCNSSLESSAPLVDEGITVKGSECQQKFNYVTMGETDPAEVIVIGLKGLTETSNTVTQPVTVSQKLQCSSCGKWWKTKYKFCPNCGTYLE